MDNVKNEWNVANKRKWQESVHFMCVHGEYVCVCVCMSFGW